MLAAFAEKSLKEVTYHLRHTSQWVIRLGDGTVESKEKVQGAIATMWGYTEDMFDMNEADRQLVEEGVAIDLDAIKADWKKTIDDVLARATLSLPQETYMHSGSRKGLHSEYLGHLLCEMQYIQRAYPNSEW